MQEKKTYEAWEQEQRIAAAHQLDTRRPPTPSIPDPEEFLEMLFERGCFDD